MKRIPLLAKPLANTQIKAAGKFWKEGSWETKEFDQLRQCFPNPQGAVTLKAVALNTLYGTNVIAISRVAECLESLKLNASHSTGPDMVEKWVAEIKKVANREYYVFVAKFAHFFITRDLPILDYYAEWMVREHLGRRAQSRNPKRYLKFVEDIEQLKKLAGLNCTCAQLDAYLWVAGEYWRWKKNPRLKINGDLRCCFERREENFESEPDLTDLLGLKVNSASA